MNAPVEYRGEQQAMSSKHTGVNPDDFDDYIVRVTNTKPTLTIDIDPSQSIEDARLKHVDELFGDMRKRIISGELDNSTPISLPEEFRARLADLMQSRVKSFETDKFILFSYRVDEFHQSWVHWGGLGYIPHAIDPMELPQVKKALTRIRSRGNITGIKVVGLLPRHHYFGRDISDVVV